jgi:hypothetical protein
MSLVKVSGNASGTGTLTIAAPNTNSDRTLTLPDATGTVFVSGQPVTATTGNFSGDVTLGSSVLATPTGSAPSYLCRAWVNFNGTGTPSIRGSGNVSSITDLGVGSYRLNFDTALPDGNYSVAGSFLRVSLPLILNPYSYLTGSLTFESMVYDATKNDPEFVSISVFR